MGAARGLRKCYHRHIVFKSHIYLRSNFAEAEWFADPNGSDSGFGEFAQEGGPGALFNSADAAALDWGMRYNDNSIVDEKEYASTIYEVRVAGRPFYSYTKPKIGSQAESHRSPAPLRFKAIGHIHSHSNWTDASDEKFSEGDLEAIADGEDGWLYYLTTPNGALRKHGLNIPLDTSLPSDQSAPVPWNSNDSRLGPKDEPTFGSFADWMDLLGY